VSPADRYQSAEDVARALEDCTTVRSATRRRTARQNALAVAVLVALAVNAVLLGMGPAHFEGGEAPAVLPGNAAIVPVPAPRPEPAPAKVEAPAPPVSPETAWENTVTAMPAPDLVAAVNARLALLNPGYNAAAAMKYDSQDGAVFRVLIVSSSIVNVSPLRAFKALRELTIYPVYANGGPVPMPLSDLTPFRNMKVEALHVYNAHVRDLSPLAGLPLNRLTMWGFAGTDLGPLRGLPLTELNIGLSKVEDLSPLRGMPLTFLCANISAIRDLTPLEGMRLKELLIERTQVTDLAPVTGMPLELLAVRGAPVAAAEYRRIYTLPLKHLLIDFERNRDGQPLRAMKTLERINHQPAAEILAAGP
jgi:hypothetical protein